MMCSGVGVVVLWWGLGVLGEVCWVCGGFVVVGEGVGGCVRVWEGV